MEIEAWSKKISEFLKKYRYAAIILLLGIALMLLPSKEKVESVATDLPTEPISCEESMDVRLAQILSQINGAGKVEVLLTKLAGEEIVYQTDQAATVSEGNNVTQVTTIIVNTENKEETGLIRQVIPPKYLGAVVVCQGADRASVRLAIVDAVAKVTGLGSDCISVLKMK